MHCRGGMNSPQAAAPGSRARCMHLPQTARCMHPCTSTPCTSRGGRLTSSVKPRCASSRSASLCFFWWSAALYSSLAAEALALAVELPRSPALASSRFCSCIQRGRTRASAWLVGREREASACLLFQFKPDLYGARGVLLVGTHLPHYRCQVLGGDSP